MPHSLTRSVPHTVNYIQREVLWHARGREGKVCLKCPLCELFIFINLFCLQEGYISAVKAVLKQVVCLDKDGQGDCVEKNGQLNGCAENGNGNHKDNGEVESVMDTQEEGDSMKSPSAPKGKGRRSKSDPEPKSESLPPWLLVLYL